ncbi:hypothetical protein [Streptomyces sp. NPDC002553]|uniref:hypothetical protein n=1 Tax=Streptomyces sp. NPDC002553 TaxID=3154417 RepID=UPI0033216DD5
MTNSTQHDGTTDPLPDFHTNINQVIGYLWGKEHADYHQQDADGRARHIIGPLTRLRAMIDPTGHHTPNDCCAPTKRYALLVPGLITLYTDAPTEAAARHELALEGGNTLDLRDAYLTVGRLTITALDLVPAAAKLDKIDDTLIDDSLPDADFHISDIARVAARILGDNWTATAGAYAVTGSLENKARGTGTYTLSVTDGTLQLQHERWADPCAEFDGNDLPALADAVATAILDDLCRNEHCGESTADGEGYDGECGNCADRTARAENAKTEETPRTARRRPGTWAARAWRKLLAHTRNRQGH